jgi:hypothetical protein
MAFGGGPHRGMSIAASSEHDFDAVAVPPVAGLDNRQRWRERKGGRHSCGANRGGNGCGRRGEGLASPLLKQRGEKGAGVGGFRSGSH